MLERLKRRWHMLGFGDQGRHIVLMEILTHLVAIQEATSFEILAYTEVSFGGLYPTIRWAEQEGMVSRRMVPGFYYRNRGGREVSVYSITDKGMDYFTEHYKPRTDT